MTERQKELARHALGLGGRRIITYRNYFTGRPSLCPDWMAMVESGEAYIRVFALCGGFHTFALTRTGADAALNPGEQLDPEDWL